MEKEYKNSGIEWIERVPKRWKISRFKYILEAPIETGKRPNEPEGNILSIGGEHIQNGDFDFTHPMYVSLSTYNGNKGKIQLYDTLVVKDGATIGKSMYVSYMPNERMLLNEHVYRIKCHKFYFYWILSDIAQKWFRIRNQSTAQESITGPTILNIPIVIPSLNEQDRIVSYLDKKCGEIDELIALQEKMIAQLTEYKQAVITEAVTKGLDPNAKLVPSGIEWIGDVPEGWKVCRIKNVASLFGRIGFRGYTSEDLNKDGEGAITLSPSNMRPMGMDYTNVTYLSWYKYNESPEIQIQNGDLLMVKTGSSYGKVSYVEGLPREATINPQILRIIPFIDPRFLGYYLQTPLFIFQVEGGVVGGTIPTISQEKIYNFFVVLPPKTDQHSISTYLDTKCSEIDSLITLKRQKIEFLNAYKKSVIYEAVTGKTDIN